MSQTERKNRKKGIPPNTPPGALIGGEYGYCYNGIAGCVYRTSCLEEGHCILQYEIDDMDPQFNSDSQE